MSASSLFSRLPACGENTSGKPSSACFFHCAICVGWTPYSAAISLAVFCPLIASKATRVFSSALYRFRCTDIVFLLLAGFSIQLYYHIDLSSFLVPSYYETEFFDFKEMLPHSKNEPEKTRLYKSCCAFANSSGGFLIFGVKDDRALSPKDRLVGIDQTRDLPELFGSYPKNCNPSIPWNFLNLPLPLGNGNVIHIFEIPRSWNAPHSFEVASNGRCFVKRTNKGNEPMSYEEIRMAFLQYYEKRLKLQLLQAELQNTRKHAEELIISPPLNQAKIILGEFSLIVIEMVLADTYTILAGQQELLELLGEIRNRCRMVNDMLRIFYRVATVNQVKNNVEPYQAIETHNKNVEGECRPIIFACDRTLGLLEKVMKI